MLLVVTLVTMHVKKCTTYYKSNKIPLKFGEEEVKSGMKYNICIL